MSDATRSEAADEDWRGHAYDLVRGMAAYTASPLLKGIGKVIARHPDADVANAFNHKQVACKLWARDRLFALWGGGLREVWIVGGWYGVLAAMLLEDPRFAVGRAVSIDIDPSVEPVARTLNAAYADRFEARTADMYALDYAAGRPDLVVNTSCEHIADLRGWLSLLPPATRVLLQSNDYFREPTHVACMPSLAAFAELAGLKSLAWSGALPQRNYTRFMLIGSV